MSLVRFKRFRMELNVGRQPFPRAVLPPGYLWQAWQTKQCLVHARVKYESFVEDLDSDVFPCLGDRAGCRRLMYEISQHSNFLPRATWIVAAEGSFLTGPVPCGTIQGILESRNCGNIQNVGVVPTHRRRGLGLALVLKALEGFREAGARRIALEVTAANESAVNLYQQLGFRVTKTSYREVEIQRTEVSTASHVNPRNDAIESV